ncbi:hypothetical protein [Novosphingobium sp. Chol11]|uniref:hypothetical protein n=1 Tax=Novosphingobium sp. Chol11 TaxID=1385763 RepID=UPI000BE41FFD|nr:hypothetical protein [Novosphingobium sp. Chol11]
MAILVAFFALDNVLLLGFLGRPPLVVWALALLLPSLLGFAAYRLTSAPCRISLPTILVCFLVAAALLILGGEGRLFYAPTDWQVRDAVLADMGRYRWPFDYWLDGRSQMLRAPIGMYLIPALLGGVSQFGRDWMLLAQNSLILGLLFALGSTLFEGRRARWIALIVFVMFSGLDVLGNLIVQSATGEVRWDHIEDWGAGYQYSAHITQLFWVPQHALAGWAVALVYLLWRRNLVPIGIFGAILPLVALWSPLILFGTVPFALFAALRVLGSRSWNWLDISTCLIATAASAAALVYLSTDSAAVGGGLRPPTAILYLLIMLFEVTPFLLPVLHDRNNGVDRTSLAIAAVCLFLMPSWSIGMFNDFQTRASIMPLAILAVAYADWATRIAGWREKVGFGVVIVLGSFTGVIGIANALRFAPTPIPHCSVAGIWERQSTSHPPHSSYFAARDAFPFSIVAVDRVSSIHQRQCWDRPWRGPARPFFELRGR